MCAMPHSTDSDMNFRFPTNIGIFRSDGPVSDNTDITDIVIVSGSTVPSPFSRKKMKMKMV